MPRFAGFGVALLAIALAAFASCRARDGTREATSADAADWDRAVARLDSLPPLSSPIAGRPFWIGAWVGPPVAALDAETWRRFGEAGLDVSIGPLEDRFHRADNVARLRALDGLVVDRLGPPHANGDTIPLEASSLFTFVRDDSLHPDETTRPGWEARIEAIVRTYQGHRSLAGYFLADEPAEGDRAAWAPAARLLRRLDPVHPAYVNFVGLDPGQASDGRARARWRAGVETALREGELPFFTFDAYPFPVEGGERGNFLASLREAARVSHATQRPFGAVLQFTGHGGLRAATAAEASYQAMEALAHGASCIVWFTYWTPNPREEPWRWHDGAVAYDGTATSRLDTLSYLDMLVRWLAVRRGPGPLLVAHLGGGLPAGIGEDPLAVVPDLDSLSGGPVSIGFSAVDSAGRRTYVVVNRDRGANRSIGLHFAPGVASVRVWATTQVGESRFLDRLHLRPSPHVWLKLGPGDAAVLTARRQPTATSPRTPSRSGTR